MITALWKSRVSTPDQRSESGEDEWDEEERFMMLEETGSIVAIGDVQYFRIFSEDFL